GQDLLPPDARAAPQAQPPGSGIRIGPSRPTRQRNKSFDEVNIFVYHTSIVNEQRRCGETRRVQEVARSQGATFKEGTNHTKVYLNGKQTTLPRHRGKEIGEGLRQAILKQLGLK